jgi:hypothetical protein
VRIGAAGKVVTAFDIARTMALGADWCNAARGFMFSLGCIQSLSCHTDHCPTGIATQDPRRQRSLVPRRQGDAGVPVPREHARGLRELIGAAGLLHPAELGPEHIIRRISTSESRPLSGCCHSSSRALLDGVPRTGVPGLLGGRASRHVRAARARACDAQHEDRVTGVAGPPLAPCRLRSG